MFDPPDASSSGNAGSGCNAEFLSIRRRRPSIRPMIAHVRYHDEREIKGGRLQRPPSRLGLMDILKAKHIFQPLFLLVIKSTACRELLRIFVSTKEHVPPDDVSIVVAVLSILVMDPVHLWALEDIADPARRLHIRVIEELAQGRACGIDGPSFQRQSHDAVHQDASNQRVHNHLQRMLVKRGDHLNALRAMVDLVKQPPKSVRAVPPSVPPIKDEGRNEIGQHPSG